MSLHERLDFFESNWAFFAGFGMLTIYDLMGYVIYYVVFPLVYSLCFGTCIIRVRQICGITLLLFTGHFVE